MLAEDLEQEAREAVIRHLREDPGCPESHLVVETKDAIYKYRRRGSSVDGKLNQEGRDNHYQMVSLQEPISHEDERLKEEVTGDPRQPRRPTEEEACTRVLFDLFEDSLTEEEIQALALRLAGIPWEKVGETLGLREWQVSQMREGIEEKALVFWERPDPRYYTPELPPALLEVLTEQERRAVGACQRGATQTEAARQSGLSQATVSRILVFVRKNRDKLPEEITSRTTRCKNDHRREQFLALFYNRPPGELVTYEELLNFLSDLKNPLKTLWEMVSRYNRQLEGARITLVKGQGYVLVEGEKEESGL